MNKIYKKLGINSSRTQNIAKHIGWSTLFKGGSILANFLLVPITIDYLDQENYGVWLTLSSFISWFSFFDIGLGNGLRNKFAEAKAIGDMKLAKAYVSSAYYTITFISLILVVLFLIANTYIDWTNVFNTDVSLQKDLSILMPVIVGFFGLQLVSKLITTIYTADQNHSLQGKIDFFTKLLSLIVVWFLTKTNDSSLLIFGIVFSVLPVIILIGLNFFAFSTKYKDYKPSIKLWKKEHIKDIMSVGISFFIIQIAAIVLFSTDNFIIIKLFGPTEVVPYNLAYKYYSILVMGYSIIIAPYWSSFTEAYTKGDLDWIKKSVKNIQKIWLLIPLGLIIMLILSKWFFKIWVGEEIKISLELSLAMILFVILMTYNMIFVNFINGTGKVKLQLITALISMTINIPLSILFVKVFHWGLSGVVLATCVSLGYSVILRPIQYKKIINKTATGIWNK
ncbi:lipopolysaccharide biosynthesis protein [Cellulophaga sp. Z1A5H]|uniref:lipopolysaccharide biosynthesis protein n=1 Tax=Cellulophaga sp. Z1A5H TaxID=2687291 RepID=UPI0013FD4B88|nr:oligosaccharide flippase family protein [Cellulophaga sp. Z1A5H]